MDQSPPSAIPDSSPTGQADPSHSLAAEPVNGDSPENVDTPSRDETAKDGLSEVSSDQPSPQSNDELPAIGTLEELTLPSLIQPPTAVPPGTILGPDGRLRVVNHLEGRGRVNRYAATWRGDDGDVRDVELREGPLDDTGLSREADVFSTVRYAMLPRLIATFEEQQRRYLVLEPIERTTLEEAMVAGLDTDAAISTVLQLTQAVRRLHRDGWAVIGLAPPDIVLGEPLKIARLATAARIGATLLEPFHVAGISPPELAQPGVVTDRADVYTLGAILYRAISGQWLPESGVETAALPSAVNMPGVPQLLAGALAPPEERLSLDDFYQGLLALKQRSSGAPITLEVASATTVGLNPTRHVNEDSCGYATWTVGGAEGTQQRAVLCVADGMGGMDAGEIASRAALDAVMTGAASFLTASGGPPDPIDLIRRAAPAVHAAAAGRQTGTTATCAIVENGVLSLGHIGDTRAYLFRLGSLMQLTQDHSLVAAMVASGVITADEARGHPDSNKVLRSLGGHRELPPGYVDGLEAATGESQLTLEAGDWLLLCSDGVWGSVEDADIQTVLSEAMNPAATARALIERALDAGAPDNASAIVARAARLPS